MIKLNQINAFNLHTEMDSFTGIWDTDDDFKVEIYDEGKAEGGWATFKITETEAIYVDHSGSGPWGIPPMFEEMRGDGRVSREAFLKALNEELEAWYTRWLELGVHFSS